MPLEQDEAKSQPSYNSRTNLPKSLSTFIKNPTLENYKEIIEPNLSPLTVSAIRKGYGKRECFINNKLFNALIIFIKNCAQYDTKNKTDSLPQLRNKFAEIHTNYPGIPWNPLVSAIQSAYIKTVFNIFEIYVQEKKYIKDAPKREANKQRCELERKKHKARTEIQVDYLSFNVNNNITPDFLRLAASKLKKGYSKQEKTSAANKLLTAISNFNGESSSQYTDFTEREREAILQIGSKLNKAFKAAVMTLYSDKQLSDEDALDRLCPPSETLAPSRQFGT